MTPQWKRVHLAFIFSLILVAAGCGKREGGQLAFSSEQPAPYVTTEDVRVRSGPGTQYKVVAELKGGTKINVVGREGEWLKIVSKRGNPPGYVNQRFARPEGKGTASLIQGSYIITAETYVREGPGLHYPVITKVPKGMKIHVVNAEGDWLKVESKHGRRPGYVEKIYAQSASGR